MFNTRLWKGAILAAALCFACEAGGQTVSQVGPERTLALNEAPGRITKPVVSQLALDPTGRFLATAGDDHLVRVWDGRTGSLLHRLEGHLDWIRACVFSPTGRILATAGQDRQILLWDPETGQRIGELPRCPAALFTIQFSPDGRTLAAGGFERNFRLFDLANGKVLQTVEAADRDVRAIAFAPNGQLLAAAGAGGTDPNPVPRRERHRKRSARRWAHGGDPCLSRRRRPTGVCRSWRPDLVVGHDQRKPRGDPVLASGRDHDPDLLLSQPACCRWKLQHHSPMGYRVGKRGPSTGRAHRIGDDPRIRPGRPAFDFGKFRHNRPLLGDRTVRDC